MKAILAVLVVLLAAYAFGPHLFSGRLVINGLGSAEPPPARTAEPASVAPAVFLPGSDSPIFPEPTPRPARPRAQETRLPPRDGAPSCLGPYCYQGR